MNAFFLFIKEFIMILYYTNPIIGDSIEEAEVKLKRLRGGEMYGK